MKDLRYMRQFFGKINLLNNFLGNLHTPDFNLKIVFYEK